MAALDYQTIMQNALNNVGTIKANNIIKRKSITDLLTQYMDDSKKNREKSHLGNRESSSSRGLLQSGQSLKDISDTNTDYDTANFRAQSSADTQTGLLNNEDLNAQNAYDTAKSSYDAQVVIEAEQAKAAAKKADDDAKAEATKNAAKASIGNDPTDPTTAHRTDPNATGEPATAESFLQWHYNLPADQKAAFNATYNPQPAYTAPKPTVAKKAPVPVKPKVVVPVKPKAPVLGKKNVL